MTQCEPFPFGLRLSIPEGVSFLSEPDDETLARCSAEGDEQAFAQLVRRYERQLALLIQYQVSNANYAEDILQETLLHAWLGIRQLREPSKFGAWLLHNGAISASAPCEKKLKGEKRIVNIDFRIDILRDFC